MAAKKQKGSISLGSIHILMIFGAVLIAGLMLVSTVSLSSGFKKLTEKNEQAIATSKAAHEMMDASDYLTEKAQRFVIDGDTQHLKAYYDEVYVVQHREDALNIVSSNTEDSVPVKKLRNAMQLSEELMDTEYYAMRLVVEAKGIKNYPDALNEVTLTDKDKALSDEEKIELARDMVFGSDYYAQKIRISDNIMASLDELESQTAEEEETELKSAQYKFIFLRAVIVFATISLFLSVWLASHLGIKPVLRAVQRIKDNEKLPEEGPKEFRYLVQAYNKMYDVYQESLVRLNYKAYHDELTGVYNRAGYQSIISTIEMDSTYMLMFDVDDFKSINDTLGHEAGDAVLKRLVDVLQKNFRPSDSLCRIGGDEFVLFLRNFPQKRDDLIAEKLEKVNSELSQPEGDTPAMSISVGIVHGSDAGELRDFFEKTDVAMYKSKQNGKSSYTFY